MKNIPLGRYSFFLAALVWLGLCVGVIALQQNQLYFFKDETGQRILTCWFFSGLGMALLGVGGSFSTDLFCWEEWECSITTLSGESVFMKTLASRQILVIEQT